MAKSGGSKNSALWDDSDYVTVKIPKEHARDLLHALNEALGGQGSKPKDGKEGASARKK